MDLGSVRGRVRGMEERPIALELFSGGGGLALGLHDAGFHHAALVEYEEKACDSLRRNAQRWRADAREEPPWTEGAVHEADAREFLKSPAMPTGPVAMVAGGPPCQPFSLGGLHAGDRDERNMFTTAIDYVRELRPATVLLENVAGLLRPKFKPFLDYVEDQLRFPLCHPRADESMQEHADRLRARVSGPLRTRYRVTRQTIDAADFGIPQRRRRVFIMAVRADLAEDPVPPLIPENSQDALWWEQWIEPVYWEEHQLAPPPPPDWLTESRALELKKAGRPTTERWRTVRDAIRGLPEPIDERETPGVLNHIGIPGARAYKGHTGSPIDGPAKTIKAGVHGVCGGEAMIRFHDESLRYLTVRESARVQTFPDDYEFVGARSHAMRHIGNAVAVGLAGKVGRHLRHWAGL